LAAKTHNPNAITKYDFFILNIAMDFVHNNDTRIKWSKWIKKLTDEWMSKIARKMNGFFFFFFQMKRILTTKMMPANNKSHHLECEELFGA
jgi:hypothetical protein